MTHLQKQIYEFMNDSEDLLELARSEYRIDNDDQLPPSDKSLCLWLTDYDWSEQDLIWWCGRLKLALELDQANPEPIRVPFTESDLNDLQEWEHFQWTYGGVQLFIFNTDSTPQFDPDSDEYDPSIFI